MKSTIYKFKDAFYLRVILLGAAAIMTAVGIYLSFANGGSDGFDSAKNPTTAEVASRNIEIEDTQEQKKEKPAPKVVAEPEQVVDTPEPEQTISESTPTIEPSIELRANMSAFTQCGVASKTTATATTLFSLLGDPNGGPPTKAIGGTITYQWEFSGSTAGATGLPPTGQQTLTVPSTSTHASTPSYMINNISGAGFSIRVKVISPQASTSPWKLLTGKSC